MSEGEFPRKLALKIEREKELGTVSILTQVFHVTRQRDRIANDGPYRLRPGGEFGLNHRWAVDKVRIGQRVGQRVAVRCACGWRERERRMGNCM